MAPYSVLKRLSGLTGFKHPSCLIALCFVRFPQFFRSALLSSAFFNSAIFVASSFCFMDTHLLKLL